MNKENKYLGYIIKDNCYYYVYTTSYYKDGNVLYTSYIITKDDKEVKKVNYIDNGKSKFVIDSNRNKWTINDNIMTVLSKIIGISDCFECEDCYDCSNCYGCSNCIDCSFCYQCKDCKKCYHCYSCIDCENCNGCTQCFACKHCELCGKSTFCEDCRKCDNYSNTNSVNRT